MLRRSRRATARPSAEDAQDGVDEAVHAQRLAAGDARVAVLIERIEEVGEQGAVGVVRESHRIGAAAGALLFADALLAAIVVVDRDACRR